MDALTEALIDLTYNPHEARDSRGRWTDALDRAIAGDTDELEALVHADHGPSRITMPQLSGVPAPGSKADKKFHPGPGKEVDLTDQFAKELEKAGVSVQTEQVKISDLKPTQDELVGATVAGLSKFMLHAPADSPVFEPIFVSADNHVIDGHHRWAARTVRSKINDTPDETMAVRKIGLNIADALPVATQFMEEWGLPVAGMGKQAVVANFTTDAVADILLAHSVEHELRDAAGRWTDTPGAALKKTLSTKRSYKGKANKPFPGEPSYAAVEAAYDWDHRDQVGSDGTNANGIHEQGLAQIHAKTWASNVTPRDSEDEQYAESIWDAYQDPNLYAQLNAMLRTGKKDPEAALTPEQTRRDVGLMFEHGGWTTTKPMKVYRALKSKPGLDWAEKLKPGTVFEDDGIVSTTAHNRISQGWLAINPTSATGGKTRKVAPNDVMMEIALPVGTRIMGGTPEFIETMLPPGTKFKIISSETRTAAKPDMPLGGDKALKPFTYTHVTAEVQ